MAEQEVPTVGLREKIRAEMRSCSAADLLPHHRRDALLVATPDQDILAAAVAIASDATEIVAILVSEKKIFRPSLAQLSDWCVQSNLRFQYAILQPYVLVQALPEHVAHDFV